MYPEEVPAAELLPKWLDRDEVSPSTCDRLEALTGEIYSLPISRCNAKLMSFISPTEEDCSAAKDDLILGSSRPFDDIREIELTDLGARYDPEGDTQSESASIADPKRFKLLSPPKKVKAK